jgi:HD superfamily phosphodiesterase
MTDSDQNNIVLEILKKIQGSQTDLRNGMADIRRDVRTIKDEIVSLRTVIGEFIKTDARRESDYLGLARRVDRLEERMDMRDNPNS